MPTESLFCHLSSEAIANLIDQAEGYVCYAAPGISERPANAIVRASKRIGTDLITVMLDFDERVMRMGYGDNNSVNELRNAEIVINHSEGLRSALIIVDNEGYTFTPTPLYLEAETDNIESRNALKLSREQVAEALTRLSPASKAIALAKADSPEEIAKIKNIPLEVGSSQVSNEQFARVKKSLEEAPPVKFDVARQVRVFEPYLQYVELSLTGAAIQRHRLAIPDDIQNLGGSQDLEGRLRTTFDLIENDSKLSSKPLESDLNVIRKNFTPSLGKEHGRVVLKSAKPHLQNRIDKFREKLKIHQKEVGDKLQKHLDASRKQIIKYYLPLVIKNPPDSLLGQILTKKPSKDDASKWLNAGLERVFPRAELLINVMKLEERFKDVTFETLDRDDFLESVKEAFPNVDWEKAYDEFRAAGEVQLDI